MKKFSVKKLVIAVIIFILCYLVFSSGILKTVDNIFTDMLYQKERNIDNNIKIIAIDEKTLDALGPFGSWDRQVYADLINILTTKDIKPAVIGFDISFFGNISKEGDEAFAKSAAVHGNVCSVSHVMFKDELGTDEKNNTVLNAMVPSKIELPYKELLENVEVGFANMAADSDSIVRSVITKVDYNNEEQYGFAAKCYLAYANATRIQTAFPQTDAYYRWWIPYAGFPGDFETISLIDVLNGNVPPILFDDTLVLVGAYAPGLQDAYNVPIEKGEQMYGVEIHANVIQALLEGKYALPVNQVLMWIVFSACAALLYLAFSSIKKAVYCAILLIGVIIANVLLGIVLYNNGHIINIVYLPLAAIIIYIITLVYNYILESTRRRKVTNIFKKYVAPQVVEELLKEGKFEIKLGGENRNIAVMFVDIRGFTPLCERLAPKDVVGVLNSYLNLTTQAIFKNGGTLDKFIGDATMAIYNAPFDLPDYVMCAANTALDILKGAEELEKELMEKYNESVGFGIGLHCGEAVVGNIGCSNRMDYTAIGDTVNTSARLESNAKRAQILMSEAFYNIIKERVSAKEMGVLSLKGKSKEINVYELLEVKADDTNDDNSLS